MLTGKSLTIKDNNIVDGTEIVQYDYQGLDSQKWIINDSKKNGWIVSPLYNPQLSITVNGNIINGSKIKLSQNESNDYQMFYLFNISKDEQTKPNGLYKMAVGKDPNKTIEVPGGNGSNNVLMGISNFGELMHQKFYFEYQKEGYYKITAMHTRKSITIKNGIIEDGSDIVQYDYKGLDSQKWIIRDSKKNGWIITPLTNPQLAISINGDITNGSKLKLAKCQVNDKQMYYLFNITQEAKTKDNGTYNIAVGADSSKSIEVPAGNTANNVNIGIWTYGNGRFQKFDFEYVNGYYKITALHTGKSLTVKNNDIKAGTEIVQDEYKDELGQMWILRDSKINGWIISPLARPDLAITVENSIQNGSKIILDNLQYNNRQMFYCFKIRISVNIDSNKYPGFADKIDQLATLHPNWDFEILYTTIDFNTAVQGEYEYAGKRGNLVYTPSYKGDWIAPSPYVSGSWASASYKGISYFMDSRNFLNDVDIFQFLDLSNYSSGGATLNSIQYQVNGTFLQSYANDVKNVCERVNINPYYALARLFQEQGINGSATIYMNGGDGRLYFNPFNIGAEVGRDVETALARAKREGWDTMAKGMEGGLRIIKSYYIDKMQHTLYLNKFDVNPASGGGFYNHQYMQNLSAAYSEARILRDAYAETNVLNNKIKFIIPVYENMPATISEKPKGVTINPEFDTNETNCNDRVMVKTNDNSGTNVRSGPGTGYSIIRALPDQTKGTRVLTGKYYNNGYWWDKVYFDDGTVGFVATNFLRKI